MKILVIDNYDSFTFNLVQLLGIFTKDITVVRNDKSSLEALADMKPDKVVISPGPGKPEDSKISLDVIKTLGKNIPLLGVCLGHQGIGISFGGCITYAPSLMHGKISRINHDGKEIYKNIPQKFDAARYHSLVIDKNSLSNDLDITAETDDGVIMGIRHKEYPIEGIQFHPESILTTEGKHIIKNWIAL
jgi:anthranilate synthase/aminodeoxychorismate synthase-like glutamine amidotransferase